MLTLGCWPISRDTKSFLTSLTCGVKTCIIRKNFPARLVTVANEPSSQTFKNVIFILSGKTISISTSSKYRRSAIWLKTLIREAICKISVPKRLGHGTHSQNGNEPNARKKTLFRIK